MLRSWDRLPDETALAFGAFALYREMGPERTTAKIRQRLGKTEGYQRQLEFWSSKYGWVSRCVDYDAHLDHIRQQRVKVGIEKIAEKHAAIASGILGRAVQALQYVDMANPTLREVAYVADIAVKMERLSSGMTTENRGISSPDGTAVKVDVARKRDLSKMSDEELDDLERLLGKIEAVADDAGTDEITPA